MRSIALRAAVSSLAIGSALAAAPSRAQSTTQTLAPTTPAQPTTSAGQVTTIQEVVVTAQKRSERISDVPISITAVTGAQLSKQGITSAQDLERVVPGFTFQPSSFGVPVFAIRGVGFYDTSLAVAPAVSVYLDQVPLPYLAMTPGVSFDLAQVEALKGPQGTLFGENSTGGAINYIAAKPTKSFNAGFSASYGSFNEVDTEGFVSGPLSDTVSARLAVRSEERDDWQESYTRDASLGQRNFQTGRFLIDWKPNDRLKFELNLNGWIDRSDTQAAQYLGYAPTVPNGRPEQAAALPNYPVAPSDIRSADWDSGANYKRNNQFYQTSLRGDASLASWAQLTSITAYSNYRDNTPTDPDGTNFTDIFVHRIGYIRSFSQELRLSGQTPAFKWMIGGNGQFDKTEDDQYVTTMGSNQSIGPFTWDNFENENRQSIKTLSGFGSLDYSLTDTLTLQGSARYTSQNNDFTGCLRDVGGQIAEGFSFLSTALSGTPTVIPTGACVSLGANAKPITIDNDKLDQNNISWRTSLNWKPSGNTLLYANVTRGYKAGGFSTLPAIEASQLTPIGQESLLAYEGGYKLSLLNRRVQLSGAGFYYDYSNKQILGYVNTGAPFGNLPGLVSIPKSSVDGAEIELTARPSNQLRLTFGVTYVNSQVDKNYMTTDPFATAINVKGEQFPNTPKLQLISDTEYTLPINNNLSAFAGGSIKYRSSSYAAFGENSQFEIKDYAVLDLRAGVQTEDGRWRLQAWGRNVTDQRYLLQVTHVIDTVAALTGMPATYGVTLTYRYQ